MIHAIRFGSLFLGLVCVGISWVKVDAQGPSLSEVLASTPSRANAILYADVSSLRSLTTGSMMYDDLPASMGEVRIAAELNFKTLQPAWEIGYVTVAGWKNSEALAKHVKGYVDAIAGKSVVWTPRQSYLVPMADNVLGFVRPSDRKIAARWLNKDANSGSASYLKQHAIKGTKFLSLLFAVDLQDTWSPIVIEQRIESLESMKGQDLKAMATTLSTVQGIQIIVGRKNLDECIISLDFGSSPAKLLPVAKDFFAELLRRNSTSIPESSKWTATMDGNTIAFRGTMSVDTLDHLMGIFTIQGQAAGLSDAALEPIQDPNSDSAKLETSKTYFAKTTNVIKRVREYSARNTGERAQWNGQMARRIDELPTLNVDPELVDFGVRVAQGLRGNMVALQQTNIKVGAAAVVNDAGTPQVGYVGGYYGGVYGVYNNESNSPGKYDAIAQAQGNYSYKELIAAIDTMEAEMRRRMTDKYKVQF